MRFWIFFQSSQASALIEGSNALTYFITLNLFQYFFYYSTQYHFDVKGIQTSVKDNDSLLSVQSWKFLPFWLDHFIKE